MSGPPLPRHALSAVPHSQATVTRLLDRLYMSKEDLHTATQIRGLTREQMEMVIIGISLANECFY